MTHAARLRVLAGLAAGLLAAAWPAVAGQSATLTEGAAPISIEEFSQLPFIADPQISPDGLRIAARVIQAGSDGIAIWTLSDGAQQQPHFLRSPLGQSFEWASDNTLLLSGTMVMTFDFGGVQLPIPLQRVSSYDIANDKATPLGNAGGLLQSVIYTDPAGRYALVSTQERLDRSPHVERVDLATGAAVEVQPAVRGVSTWFADPNGVVRVGVDYGERRTRLYYRPTAQAPLQLVDNRRIVDDDSVVDMVRFITDTNRGIIVTNAETGRFGIYEYDFATNTRGRALFTHPQVDVTRAVYARDGSVDGVVYEDDRPRVEWLNPAIARIQARIDRTFPDHTNVIVNQSRDGNRILVFSSAADDPGTYYVYDQAARRMEIFASPYDRLIGHRFAPVRSVSYPGRGGLTIPAYLTLPPGRPERGLPLIVLPHGGPFARDRWAFDPEVQFLASRGYAVLQPNYRGSTGYGRQYVERGYGQFGTGMIDDIDDGVDWLVQQGIADASRVCIMGASYGGYAAVWGAMRSPQRYRCAISLAGPSDLRRMLRYDVTSLIARRYAGEWQRRVRGEESVNLDAISPALHPEMLRVPLLLAHGEQDVNVPVEHSRRLLRALERQHADVESVFYPKSGHGFTDAAESADYLRRVEAFLARHNPATVAPAAAGATPSAVPAH